MYIQKLIVRNFRSIVQAEVDLANMNVIVGFNDIGKSNLLKALNLFFNGETDLGKKLNFEDDYSLYAPIRQKMAKEIVIELYIQPPTNYSFRELIKWKRTWRKEGLLSDREEIKTVSGIPIPPRSKIHSWINNLAYKYVPAVKSDQYFQNLLGDLHDTLSTTINDTLKKAGIDFIGKIKDSTEEITININKRLGFKSDIQLPSNLKELFKTLDFKTINGSFEVSLQKRGDGIKARHIPVILHFLSEQENKNKSNGSPRVNTIWGYEEPENNLELAKAYELSEEFADYSKDVQILITTHSPAFYSLVYKDDNPAIKGYAALSKDQKTSYNLLDHNSLNELNEHMGVIQIITPYIDQEIAKRKILTEKINQLNIQLNSRNQPTLYVEGITDKIILDAYFSQKKLKRNIVVNCSQEEGGVNYVHDMICAWSYSKASSICIGLFDKDEAGMDYRNRALANPKVADAINKRKTAIYTFEPPIHLLPLYRRGIKIPVCIEELFPIEVWQYAQSKNWLEPRPNLSKCINIEILVDKSLAQIFEEYGISQDLKLYILNRVSDNSKTKFANYVASLAETNIEIFDGFTKLHDYLTKIL